MAELYTSEDEGRRAAEDAAVESLRDAMSDWLVTLPPLLHGQLAAGGHTVTLLEKMAAEVSPTGAEEVTRDAVVKCLRLARLNYAGEITHGDLMEWFADALTADFPQFHITRKAGEK